MIRQDISGEFAAGGRSSIRPDDFEGAPERIVELAASSASYDLYDKLQVYRRNGVQEYLVWQVYDSAPLLDNLSTLSCSGQSRCAC